MHHILNGNVFKEVVRFQEFLCCNGETCFYISQSYKPHVLHFYRYSLLYFWKIYKSFSHVMLLVKQTDKIA